MYPKTKTFCAAAIGWVILLSLPVAGQALSAADLPDANLRKGIAAVLKTTPAKLTRDDVQSELTHLNITRRGVRRLAGLQMASSLQQLRATANPLVSTIDIAAMTALEHLEIDSCDLFALHVEDMPMLQVLLARNNLIEDIRDLRHAPQLSALFLDNNPVSDEAMETIGSLVNLNALSLNNTAVTNVSALRQLARIEYVYLNSTYVEDLTVFATMPSLKTLDIRNTRVTTLAPLVRNSALGAGDRILAKGLLLDEASICGHIPALRNRGVIVDHEGVCAQAGNKDELYVDFDYTGVSDGSQARPMNMISAAAQYVVEGGTIRLRAGASGESLTLEKPMTLVADDGTATVGAREP